MSRSTFKIISIATVLASLAAYAATMPHAGGGAASAMESGNPTDQADRPQDRSLALAGRLVRVVDRASCERAPAAVADLKALHAATEAQLAHMARLAAEYRGLDEVVAPPELKSHEDDPQFAAALRQEGALFAERKSALTAQIAALNQAKELEEREVEYTRAKQAALERQDAVLQKEFDNINSLVTRGMAVNSQKINLQQSVLQSETSILDVKLLALKAQQEVSKIARGIADLHNQWRNEALAEFNKSQQTLGRLSKQAQLAKASAGGANPASSAPANGRCEEAKESSI